jgi:hypothetical protein
MIDPMTITASISFGLGIISFLSSSLSTLVRQESEFRKCKLLLETYSIQLKDRQRDLLAWRYIWYGDHGYSEDTYYYCWGEAYEEIKARFEAINELMGNVATHLGFRPEKGGFLNLSKEEEQDWIRILHCIKEEPWQQPTVKGFVGKLAFTISTNSKLRDELALLKTLTDDLCTQCRLIFRLRQGHEIDKNPTAAELQRLDKSRALSQGLAKFANDLYSFHIQHGQDREWDLELRLPDSDGDAAQLDLPASISIDFLLQCKCHCESWTAQRFRVLYYTQFSSKSNREPCDIGEGILQLLEDCQKTHVKTQKERQFEILEAPRSQGLRTREILRSAGEHTLQRKALEIEMLAISLSLVNWAFLLWNTSWMPVPCTCRLRRTILRGSTITYVMQSCLEEHLYPRCFNIGDDKHKLLALGCVLAELSLGAPISIDTTDDQQISFLLSEERLSKADLLQKVRRSSGNIGIFQSIRYCFNHENADLTTKLEQLHEHAENILKP